jgi:hypothetical protein
LKSNFEPALSRQRGRAEIAGGLASWHGSGRPSISLVHDKEEAKQRAKTLARSGGLMIYRIVDKTDPDLPPP